MKAGDTVQRGTQRATVISTTLDHPRFARHRQKYAAAGRTLRVRFVGSEWPESTWSGEESQEQPGEWEVVGEVSK